MPPGQPEWPGLAPWRAAGGQCIGDCPAGLHCRELKSPSVPAWQASGAPGRPGGPLPSDSCQWVAFAGSRHQYHSEHSPEARRRTQRTSGIKCVASPAGHHDAGAGSSWSGRSTRRASETRTLAKSANLKRQRDALDRWSQPDGSRPAAWTWVQPWRLRQSESGWRAGESAAWTAAGRLARPLGARARCGANSASIAELECQCQGQVRHWAANLRPGCACRPAGIKKFEGPRPRQKFCQQINSRATVAGDACYSVVCACIQILINGLFGSFRCCHIRQMVCFTQDSWSRRLFINGFENLSSRKKVSTKSIC